MDGGRDERLRAYAVLNLADPQGTDNTKARRERDARQD
jgi:hypothetical protein